jgi:hypothetical protein
MNKRRATSQRLILFVVVVSFYWLMQTGRFKEILSEGAE